MLQAVVDEEIDAARRRLLERRCDGTGVHGQPCPDGIGFDPENVLSIPEQGKTVLRLARARGSCEEDGERVQKSAIGSSKTRARLGREQPASALRGLPAVAQPLRKNKLAQRQSYGGQPSLREGWCRGEDSNFHNLAVTRPSSVRVYQFRHHGK